jgi:hypothetical protein
MENQLTSIGQMVKETGEPLHRVVYAIRSRQIPAVARFGNARVFDRAGVERVKTALAEIRQRKTSSLKGQSNEKN